MNFFNSRVLSVPIFLLASFTELQALPIGFGRTQGDLSYDEIKSEHFRVYHDERVPHEAEAILRSLEASRPVLESWIGKPRSKPLPVIVSSTTSNASFANFITDALELQTLGQGDRDLAWHEYTHNMMYQYLYNILGPTGSIIHLPWLPAWWIEGFAESTSVSIGSDWMYSIERNTALNNRWPSYAKLHSLYSSSFSTTGYAISGAFVSYILRTYGADKVDDIMDDFFDYTLPWWWPLTVIPFHDFMPFDQALKNVTGKTGEELYDEYKEQANRHWHSFPEGRPIKKQFPELAVTERKEFIPEGKTLLGSSIRYRFSNDIEIRNGHVYGVYRGEERLEEHEILFKNKVNISKKVWTYPEGASSVRAVWKEIKFYAASDLNENLDRFADLYYFKDDPSQAHFITRRPGSIVRIMTASDRLVWLEEDKETSRFCQLLYRDALAQKPPAKPQVVCGMELNYPEYIEYLGHSTDSLAKGVETTRLVWFARTAQTLSGDRHQIIEWDLASNTTKEIPNLLGGKPISMGLQNNHYWMLLANQTHTFLRQTDRDGQCLDERLFSDHATRMLPISNEALLIETRHGFHRPLYQLDPLRLDRRSCQPSEQPRSPLNYAMIEPNLSFSNALSVTNGWGKRQPEMIRRSNERTNRAPSVAQSEISGLQPVKRDAVWRGRPVFAFPWIGADVAGYQLGMISVPVMDEMQNETVRFAALYGIYSRFPNLELGLLSTRFKTTVAVDVFRRQRWNGSFRGDVYYYEEKGAKVTFSRYLNDLRLNLSGGFSASYLEPYIGPDQIWALLAKGYLQELNANLSQSFAIPGGRLGYLLYTAVAPEELNGNFSYDRLGMDLNYSVPINLFSLGSTQSYGVSYSRTRGKQPMLLQEYYRPLKTFVPGSGGGFNEINVSLLGPGALTSAVYGNTQSRFKFSWTFPLIRDLETLIHIFYLERLDFTAFFNYGRAWYGAEMPSLDTFVKAHGYNFDLQSDIKGVTVNLGLGTGQVIGQDFEIYFLFGFDALIN